LHQVFKTILDDVKVEISRKSEFKPTNFTYNSPTAIKLQLIKGTTFDSIGPSISL